MANFYQQRYRRFDRRHGRDLESVNVKDLRRKLHLTQRMFARRYGIPVETIRHWEARDRRPSGAARVLLNLIRLQPIQVRNQLDTLERTNGRGRFRYLRLNLRHRRLSDLP